MKEKPYIIKLIDYEEKDYTLEELEAIFLKYKPIAKTWTPSDKREVEQHAQYRQIENLDFKEVIQKAFSSV